MEYIDIGLKKALQQGMIVGPRLLSSGKVLSTTGGHGDFYLPDSRMPVPYSSGKIADGPDEVRKASREQLKAGADWIKLMASAGGSSPEAGVIGAPQYTVEEMRAACEEAHKYGARVAAHAVSAESVKNAVTAGVDTIEHGTFADREALEMMKSREVYLVATRAGPFHRQRKAKESGISTQDLLRKQGVPEQNVIKRAILTAGRVSLTSIIDAGVNVAGGTDAGVAGLYHGMINPITLEAYVVGGMSPLNAISSSTRIAAEALGLKDLGTLEPGKIADIILVKGSPDKDVTILQNKENIKVVVKDGKIVK